MKHTVSLDEFRKNLSHIVGQVMYGNQTVFVRRHNRIGAIVISEIEYENLRDPRKRFTSKEEWERFFTLSDRVRNRMSLKDQEKLEQIIDEEIKAVRAKRQHKKE